VPVGEGVDRGVGVAPGHARLEAERRQVVVLEDQGPVEVGNESWDRQIGPIGQQSIERPFDVRRIVCSGWPVRGFGDEPHPVVEIEPPHLVGKPAHERPLHVSKA
jgi:hypothetical protein